MFRARAADGTLPFKIIDIGIGMHQEDLPGFMAILIRWIPAHSAGSTAPALACLSPKTSSIGGQIQAESEFGKGTTFHLTMPLVLGDASKLKADAPDFRFIYAPGATVLVVDDNEVNLNVASGLLRLCGIKADTTGSGEDAIEMILRKKYDIVFMDQMMPGLDGLETTQELRCLKRSNR